MADSTRAGASFDAVVVGSGFGGSIAALRLAEAGRRVLVVERGRSYADHDFPRDPFDGRRLLWRHPERDGWNGLYDLRFLSGIATLTAAGLGGGSLVYANVLVRPDPRIFDEAWPAGVDRILLDPFYDRVEAMLGPSPVPAETYLAKDAAMTAALERMGRAADRFAAPQAVEWADCELVAECEFGCRFGAKRTLDKTYLARAVELGAEVRTGTEAVAIEPSAAGYRLTVRAVDGGAVERIDGRRVVLAAGTLGTAELLLRARDEAATLPRLSRRLGERFSGNGDFIGTIVGAAEPLEPWRGPDVTSVLRAFDASPGITVATPTFSRPVMESLVGTAMRDGRLVRFLAPGFEKLLWPRLDGLVPRLVGGGPASSLLRRAVARGAGERDAIDAGTVASSTDGAHPAPDGEGGSVTDRERDPSRATAVFAIGRDGAGGRIVLRRRRRGGSRLDVVWDYRRREKALVARQLRLLRALADAYGGTLLPSPTWLLAHRTLTVHPLGGCAMGTDPRSSVVSRDGEVHGYPGLFVTDASVIPGSIGFHPVHTVAANAERIAAAIAESE